MLVAIQEFQCYLVLLGVVKRAPSWPIRMRIIFEWVRDLPRYRTHVRALFSKMYWERLIECEQGKEGEAIQQAAAVLTLYLAGKREGHFLVGCNAIAPAADGPIKLVDEEIELGDPSDVVRLVKRFSDAALRSVGEHCWRYVMVAVMRLPSSENT